MEMLLTGCPADLLTGELRQNVIFELLQDLLDKACAICSLDSGDCLFFSSHVCVEICLFRYGFLNVF